MQKVQKKKLDKQSKIQKIVLNERNKIKILDVFEGYLTFVNVADDTERYSNVQRPTNIFFNLNKLKKNLKPSFLVYAPNIEKGMTGYKK